MTIPQLPEGKVFAPKELESLKYLADLYTQAKSLVLYSEEVDPDSRSNIQVIKELRDAFDHLMRVVAARLSDTPPPGSNQADYCDKNLEKAVGHVYRAAFDALDGTMLSVKEKVVEVLEGYPLSVVTEVIPDYWAKKTRLNQLTANVAENRASKDVGGNLASTFDRYVADTAELSTFHNELMKLGPTLDECKRRQEVEQVDEDRRHRKNHFLSGLGYSIVVGLFSLAVGFFFGQYREAAKAMPAVGPIAPTEAKTRPCGTETSTSKAMDSSCLDGTKGKTKP